ncbi:MAG: DUF87 domain-containing protein [Melioribacteraceae bacterium]|jgi:hypothetical protein|nr:DUF87 domain-containing protein [Melioribacteraceae bacterium]
MREITIIYGKTGTGKSHLAKELIYNYNRVVIIDPKAEYMDGLVFNNFIDLVDYYKDNEPDEFIFICRFESDLEHEYIFKFCQIIEDVLLVVEEAEIYISPYAKSSAFLDLCRYGRHHNVSILGIARRVSELSINFRALVTRLISFKQTEPVDIKISETLGFHGLDQLQQFPDGHTEYQEIFP